MKKTIKFLLSAFCAVTMLSCGGSSSSPEPGPDPSPSTSELAGQWQLTSWSADTGALAEGLLLVYIDMQDDGSFTLYQNFTQAGVIAPDFVKFTGSYTFNAETGALSGRYSNNTAWGSTYTVSNLTSSSMRWTSSENDVATYTKTTIPENLSTMSLDGTRSGEEIDRFL